MATYHHYHSNTHEVLAVVSGWANLQLGGEKGVEVKVTKGDVIVLPAGTGHKLIEKSPEFGVVGAYPNGNKYDFCYGKEDGSLARFVQDFARFNMESARFNAGFARLCQKSTLLS
ncbi:cupin domain-containing protein [Bacillus sp. SD088]|uniref:cupin domain-containing protein n=1 Tax=Bacillus sp. SD088 TaxID=2782012 RepID=UPI001A979B32|nr:cupin domain-containing protein [Bacillus sp. SD088]MBO0994440.1 cupin domain-containing protein [Bacillus sp. SD088]